MTEHNHEAQHLYILLHDGHYACLQAYGDAATDDHAAPPISIALGCESDWLSLKDFEAFLQRLHQLENSLSALEARHIWLIHDSDSASEFARLMQQGSGLYARQWHIQSWDELFGQCGGVFDYPRPPLENVQTVLASWQAPPPPNPAPNLPHAQPSAAPAPQNPPLPMLPPIPPPTAEHLLSYLPVLYHQAFTVLGGADLAILLGELKPLDIPSPYPELSSDALDMKQRAFLALPQEQQRQIIAFAQNASKRLRPRVEMQVYIRGLE